MSALLGKKLLNYRIEKLLGQGGMGEVYLGVHTEIGRKVAIKVISPHLARDARIQERFKREAMILSKLNHPNIVQLYDYWARPEEGLYLIMEYVEGISLDRYIHRVLRGPVPPKQAMDLFLQVLDAFQYAHDNNVIHRDIKPSNILIRNDNVVKVLDFGIARIMSPDPTSASEEMALTKTGTTLGTVVYMSPEQLKSKSSADIDHRSDIYSLGVVFFEMLTGREMYDRSQLSEFEILIKIASEPPPPLQELNPQIAPDFEPILAKALAKKREDRYPSCKDFAADLLRLLPKYAHQEEELLPRNPALTQTQIGPSEGSFFQRTYARLQASWRHSKEKKSTRRLWLAGGLLLLASAILAVGWGGNYFLKRRTTLQLAASFASALHQHDETALRGLLADRLKPFFADSSLNREEALKKYYSAFWKTLKKDSVAWQDSPSAYRQDGVWYVEGDLYQSYTTREQTQTVREPEKYYNRWYARYETRYKTVSRTIPSTTVCKVKRLRLHVSEGQIAGVEVLSTRECN